MEPKDVLNLLEAAPIARYVQDRSPVVYTGGYPNLAVQRLLKMFARRGLKSVHMGNADLDGFRIAATVDRCIPVVRVGVAEVLADPAHPRLFSGEFMSANGVKNVGSVTRALNRLKDEELVYEFQGEWKFTNPFFREWLMRRG